MAEKNYISLLLLCGDTKLNLHDFTHIITFCPIRHYLLEKKGVKNHRFGDFTSDETQGKILDNQLHEILEHCLRQESKVNPALKWAPLAIQQVKWRLSRYLWLKRCFKNILKEFKPQKVLISSGKDKDILLVAKSVTHKESIELQIEDGPFDPTTNMLYLLAPYGLPSHVDPKWFVWLFWAILRFSKRKIKILYEPYSNLKKSLNNEILFSFPVRIYVSLLRKIFEKIHLYKENQIVETDISINENATHLITDKSWNHFSDDEKIVINSLLSRFIQRYPLKLINRIEENLSIILSLVKPKRIILIADQVDSSRLLTYVAHKNNIAVDYLPHGIYWEDYSGMKNNCNYLPDRMLAWNLLSQESFQSLGWASVVIKHPAMQIEKRPFKLLNKAWEKIKVFVLIPEWICVTQAGREDCAIVDMIEIYTGLTALGVKEENIYVKYHHTGLKVAEKIKKDALIRLQKEAFMRFTILESYHRTMDLLPSYDLCITSITTGIYESVLLGIPLVVFGLSANRVGGLKGFRIPHASSREEMITVLKNIDNDRMNKVYKQIADSLQAGIDIKDS